VKMHRLSDALEAWKVEAVPSAQTANERRHTFKDACREARIPEEVHDSFTGHKSASNAHAGIPLNWLAEEMAKLRFANVELPPAWGAGSIKCVNFATLYAAPDGGRHAILQ